MLTFGEIKKQAAERIKGRFFRCSAVISAVFSGEILIFFCGFLVVFLCFYKVYDVIAPILFVFLWFLIFFILERLKMSRDIMFLFGDMKPVHLRKPGMKIFIKYVITRVCVFFLSAGIRAVLILPSAAAAVVIFYKAYAGEVLSSVFALGVSYAVVMLIAGAAAGEKICCRYSLAPYYILRLRDSGIIESIRQSVYTMNGHCAFMSGVKFKCLRYGAAQLLILPAVYFGVVKNAVRYRAIENIITFGRREKAVTFICDRRMKIIKIEE